MDDHKKNSNILGNTLDYYNDDLSRKAVGKLFEQTDSPSPQPQEASDEYADTQTQLDIPLTETPAPVALEDPDIIRGYDDQEEAPVRRRTAPKKVPLNADGLYSDDIDDAQYDFSLYRKKSRKESGWAQYDEPEQQRQPEKPAPRTEPLRPAPPAAKREAPVHTQQPEEEPEPRQHAKREYVKIEHPVRNGYAPTPRTPQPKQAPQPKAPTRKPAPVAKKPLPQKAIREDDYDDEYHDYNGPPVRMFVTGGIVLVFVLILAILVVQLNGAKSKLKAANTTIETLSALEVKNGELTMSIDTLKAEITTLTEQLATAQSLTTPINLETDANPSEIAPQATTPSAAPTDTSGGTLYTVLEGDTLSKISQKFYSSSMDFKKIQDANGMTDEKIKPGQTIKIPK